MSQTQDDEHLLKLAKKGQAHALEVFLRGHRNDQGFEIDRKDPQGHTALFYAAKKQNIQCIEALLTHGADAGLINPGYRQLISAYFPGHAALKAKRCSKPQPTQETTVA